MGRQDFLMDEIAEYKRRIGAYQVMIAEWERELGIQPSDSLAGSDSTPRPASLAPGADPVSLVRAFEFATKSQPEAAKLFLERFGKPLTTDELIDGLEKGGVKLGGDTRAKKKANFATILVRAEGIMRVGRGAWALGTKKPKSDSEKKPEPEKESKDDDAK